jgi:L-cysteine desulfidase
MKCKHRAILSAPQALEILQAEIVPVMGCTEPAAIALALYTARTQLEKTPVPGSFKVKLSLSHEVFRNATTAVIPKLNKRGIKGCVAMGLAATKTDGLNLFPYANLEEAKRCIHKRGWLDVKRVKNPGIYIYANIVQERERVSVKIHGRHDHIVSIRHNGIEMLHPAEEELPHQLTLEAIDIIVRQRNKNLEERACRFVREQATGDPDKPMQERVAERVRARMGGTPFQVQTITGSGNQGLLLGIPLGELLLPHGYDDSVVFALLTQIFLSQKQKRISHACGLATKAGPALAAGLAHAQGKDLAEIKKIIKQTQLQLQSMKCPGATAACGRKAEKVLNTVQTILNPRSSDFLTL